MAQLVRIELARMEAAQLGMDAPTQRLVEATRRIHALVAIANDGAGRFLSRHSMAASRHLPQQVETSRVSSSWAMVRTPCFTASAISLSVTALQIHTYIRITFQSGLPEADYRKCE
ncbi:MAG: hypothetical protein WAR81_11655 [Pseudomonadales bacterium]